MFKNRIILILFILGLVSILSGVASGETIKDAKEAFQIWNESFWSLLPLAIACCVDWDQEYETCFTYIFWRLPKLQTGSADAYRNWFAI